MPVHEKQNGFMNKFVTPVRFKRRKLGRNVSCRRLLCILNDPCKLSIFIKVILNGWGMIKLTLL